MGIQRGGLRLMTPGEINLSQQLYHHSIQYNKVWIHHGSFLPFGMQENNTAMTPTGEIWFETNVYSDDYSYSSIDLQHLFIHEMMHVWQKQKGMYVIMRGLFSWAADYSYDLTKLRLADYSMEQQAAIVADYWLLTSHGFKNYPYIVKYKGLHQNENHNSLILKYKKVLGGFPF
ncbi:type IV secretion protein Rhs [Pantoea sp. FN0307]|uniref:type IV secretion protein Rhs n=1 Tax=Pantoea sp. FN0307 TaxID=3418560 RepID=UPI003CEB9F01